MRKRINILLEKLESESFTYDFNDHLVVSMDVASNYLIDLNNDIKSRTCGNCKHYQESTHTNMAGVHEMYICAMFVSFSHITGMIEDFGCNMFERK